MTQNLQPEASVSSFSLTVSPCLPSSRSSSLVCVLSARARPDAHGTPRSDSDTVELPCQRATLSLERCSSTDACHFLGLGKREKVERNQFQVSFVGVSSK